MEADTLAGLACDPDLESRLVRVEGGRWQLRHGPFDAATFRELPDRDWTLLVQAVDQWLEPLDRLKRSFDFLPSWRIDDVMVSYAVPGGGVGPHFDHYDVFLIQGSGQRRWRLGPACGSDTPLIDQDGVALLESWEWDREILLNQGDVLYLPPRIPHWGTAESPGLCYSIGFRAPSLGEMIEGFSDELMATLGDPARRFLDSEPRLPDRQGQIEINSLLGSFQQLQEVFADRTAFCRWFGCYATRPRYPELVEAPREPVDLAAWQQAGSLARNPHSRLAFLDPGPGPELFLFADGLSYSRPRSELQVISELCVTGDLNSSFFRALPGDSTGLELVLELLNQGCLLLP